MLHSNQYRIYQNTSFQGKQRLTEFNCSLRLFEKKMQCLHQIIWVSSWLFYIVFGLDSLQHGLFTPFWNKCDVELGHHYIAKDIVRKIRSFKINCIILVTGTLCIFMHRYFFLYRFPVQFKLMNLLVYLVIYFFSLQAERSVQIF